MVNLASLKSQSGQQREAAKLARDGLGMLERLATDGIANARALQVLARVRFSKNEFDKGLELSKSAMKRLGDVPAQRQFLGEIHLDLAFQYNLRGKQNAAEQEALSGVELLRKPISKSPSTCIGACFPRPVTQ